MRKNPWPIGKSRKNANAARKAWITRKKNLKKKAKRIKRKPKKGRKSRSKRHFTAKVMKELRELKAALSKKKP